MKKISKTDMKRLDDLAAQISNKRDEILAAYDGHLRALFDEMEDLKKEVAGVIEDFESEAQNYYDERSEKWQEGDAGSAYQDWINHFEGVRAYFEEDLDVPDLEEVLEPVATALTALNEELQSEPSS